MFELTNADTAALVQLCEVRKSGSERSRSARRFPRESLPESIRDHAVRFLDPMLTELAQANEAIAAATASAHSEDSEQRQ